MLRIVTLVVVLALGASHAGAQSLRAHAVRRTGSISVDGKLTEDAWANAPKQTGFVQRFPTDGAKPALETTFAIVYDDKALYVGVWADDARPDLVRRLLTRRDVDAPADYAMVMIDSYHDRRTAYAFQLNAAGVQRDLLISDDQNMDDTWDAVWTGDVALTERGWTAEFRIPLDQLRFSGSDDIHEWGFQIFRFVARTGEQSTWSPWPRSAPQIVSKFGALDGIEHLKPGRRLELLPYVLGGVDLAPIDAADPLNHHTSWRKNAGLDLKYGLGPAFTLSATVNPDFGQVEADPSMVNLSGSELFFAEKRPFFLEGADLFKIPIGNSDGSVEGAFYSRRIGAAPSTDNLDYQYIKAPTDTAIYAAAKLTGKTRSGWSVGLLDAVTGQETAEIVDGNNVETTPIVAPLTNYAVARVKRDLRDGGTSIGAMATSVNRDLGGTGLEPFLHDQAYTGGLTLQHRFAENTWQANVSAVGSYVHGSADAIAEDQLSTRHLFQRPDSEDSHFDPTRRSLRGGDVKWKIGRMGDTKHWRYMLGGDVRTPGLELNDAGFQRNSDRSVPFAWVGYHDNDPGDSILNWEWSADVFAVHNFEPRILDYGFECNADAQLANYWAFYIGCNIDDSRADTSALRGGPWLRGDVHHQWVMNFNSDQRKWAWLNFTLVLGRTPAQDEIDGEVDVGWTFQARSNIDVFVGPTWSWRDDPLQYVDQTVDDAGRAHYVFARIDQTTAGMTVRANWTFSPHLTLQVYAQPFIATGKYSEYKDIDNPHAAKYRDRFHMISGNEYSESDGTLTINHNGTYQVTKPDFDFRQLRSTVVLRWEYRPGSAVFAIWSHGHTNEVDGDGRFDLGHDLRGLYEADGENIFMVKANYWIGL